AFADRMGNSLSYTPWMRQLVDDEHLSYVTAYHRLNDREAIAMSIKYLDLGEASFRDETGNLLQRYSPAEVALDMSYARKMGARLAMALTARYIHRALGAGFYNGLVMAPANAFAVAVSVYSEREVFRSRRFGKR